MLAPYSALIDAPTSALLTLSSRVPIISFLAETTPEAEHVCFVNYPNYQQRFDLAGADPKLFPQFSWSFAKRQFSATPQHLLTERLRNAALLANSKSRALYEIIISINAARNPVITGLAMQETVYIEKKAQARRYKEAGYPESDLLEYPYVLQYADYSGLSLRNAADEILFKARLDDDILLKTELFRLKFFNLLVEATEAAQIDPLMIQFRQEFLKAL